VLLTEPEIEAQIKFLESSKRFEVQIARKFEVASFISRLVAASKGERAQIVEPTQGAEFANTDRFRWDILPWDILSERWFSKECPISNIVAYTENPARDEKKKSQTEGPK
jgi:hypothetical protein